MLPPNHTSAQAILHIPMLIVVLLLATINNSSPLFAHAAESPAPVEHVALSPHALDVTPGAVESTRNDDNDNVAGGGYAPDFDYFDHDLLGRQEQQTPQARVLENNKQTDMDIAQGATAYFVFKRSQSRVVRAEDDALGALEARASVNTSQDLLGEDTAASEDSETDDTAAELRKRQTRNRVWISASTCRQPGFTEGQTPKNHPQLVMYVSTSSRNQKPGPDSTDSLATPPSGILFDSGFASFELNATSDVYVGVAAPNLDDGWFGSWHFEIAASLDGSFYNYTTSTEFLYLIDTDSDSALFLTKNLSEPNTTNTTQRWIDNNPFRMYAWPVGDNTNITGMEHSLCALKNLNNQTDVTVQSSITTKFGGGDLPKSQFHVQGLKNGTKYNGFLTVEGAQNVLQLPEAGFVRGGGMVFKQFEFNTKIDDSCQVISDLEFCDSVAYAVPSSEKYKLDDDGLKALYDNKAKDYYQNFSNSLDQVACDTASDAQYSLARNCNHCRSDYKNWLCSVLIPRCEDWRANDTRLQARNINALLPDGSITYSGNLSKEFNETTRDRFAFSKSRNPMIDDIIQPGPYKELLPCEDLCFDIVRSCPAKLQFSCPSGRARELSYGKRDPDDKELWCNFPGAVKKLSVQGGVGRVRVGMGWVVAIVAMVLLI
ncbi:stretch-activated Ca2+-permeable channel component-domain-containing protein [Paraphoma chrysanthemicola]|uniref:Stretch-activated Ca2+-permeable channel component-domain-containing protein n=1 Tax=Paraphoma chrysanthemicola TaxID=798071 RepID=A0A8K0RBP6_9PLEO|nr:stretch-activated Ca2+-permeable channel component-domain-containing protein [Paraphoma chrysanthemicola]